MEYKSKYTNYGYRGSSLIMQNETERMMFEYTNEFGLDLTISRKQEVLTKELFQKPKNIVNKEYIKAKR